MKDSEGRWTGISIDLWQQVAEKLGLKFRFVEESLAPLGLTGAVDPDGDPLTYKVTTLPTSGALFVNGVQVHLNDVLTAAQFAALTYSSPETAGTYALAFDASDGTSHTVVNVNLNVGSGLGQSCSGAIRAKPDRGNGARHL